MVSEYHNTIDGFSTLAHERTNFPCSWSECCTVTDSVFPYILRYNVPWCRHIYDGILYPTVFQTPKRCVVCVNLSTKLPGQFKYQLVRRWVAFLHYTSRQVVKRALPVGGCRRVGKTVYAMTTYPYCPLLLEKTSRYNTPM